MINNCSSHQSQTISWRSRSSFWGDKSQEATITFTCSLTARWERPPLLLSWSHSQLLARCLAQCQLATRVPLGRLPALGAKPTGAPPDEERNRPWSREYREGYREFGCQFWSVRRLEWLWGLTGGENLMKSCKHLKKFIFVKKVICENLFKLIFSEN